MRPNLRHARFFFSDALDFSTSRDGSRGLARDEEGSRAGRGKEGGERGAGETGLLPTYKLYALTEIYG